MAKRMIRTGILGLLLLTLLPGPTATAGVFGEKGNCCCGEGKCPTPDALKGLGPRCCGADSDAPPPSAGSTIDPSPGHELDGKLLQSVARHTDHAVGAALPSDHPRGPSPPGVSLHTLHSVFLI